MGFILYTLLPPVNLQYFQAGNFPPANITAFPLLHAAMAEAALEPVFFAPGPGKNPAELYFEKVGCGLLSSILSFYAFAISLSLPEKGLYRSRSQGQATFIEIKPQKDGLLV
ncbi:hypothetical protein [Pontibacter kalidii]|uniref:hypothetical protein n=1 Tax=Pontibacter kalidii TaxID=2592049 RepID=UPI00224E3B44|nr:hypothetical protein [Pontibacter kalidii]